MTHLLWIPRPALSVVPKPRLLERKCNMNVRMPEEFFCYQLTPLAHYHYSLCCVLLQAELVALSGIHLTRNFRYKNLQLLVMLPICGYCADISHGVQPNSKSNRSGTISTNLLQPSTSLG